MRPNPSPAWCRLWWPVADGAVVGGWGWGRANLQPVGEAREAGAATTDHNRRVERLNEVARALGDGAVHGLREASVAPGERGGEEGLRAPRTLLRPGAPGSRGLRRRGRRWLGTISICFPEFVSSTAPGSRGSGGVCGAGWERFLLMDFCMRVFIQHGWYS